MKLAILTWLHNGNYGSILQAYALQRYLMDRGYDVNNINLNPSVVEKVKNLLQQHNSFSLFAEKKDAFMAKKACKDKKGMARRRERFEQMLNKEFELTKVFRKFKDLKELDGKYDAYICGSDQIWSPMLMCPSYFFDFVSDSRKLIAYACSLGVSSIPEEKKDKMAYLVNRFQYVSAREQSGYQLLTNIYSGGVKINVDPTFLLTEDKWNKITATRLVDGDYLLCYFLSYQPEYWNCVEKIAAQKGWKVVVVPVTKESYRYQAEVLNDVGPKEWLSLVKHAKGVITDSFHGCVFSIIFKKSFRVFKRFSDDSVKSQNSRVYTLLETYNLENLLMDKDDYNWYNISKSEYEKITSLKDTLAQDSANWLINALEHDEK